MRSKRCSVIVKLGADDATGIVAGGPLDTPPTHSMLTFCVDKLSVVVKHIRRFLKDNATLEVRNYRIELPADVDPRRARRFISQCSRISHTIVARQKARKP